jgi:sulfur carrier protein ThiS
MGRPAPLLRFLDPQMFVLKDDDFSWREDLTVIELLGELRASGKYRAAIESTGTMVVINGKIVTRDQYSSRIVGKNDIVHLMSFVTGG